MPVRALGSLLLSLSLVLSACSQASEPNAVPPPGASDAATGEEADDLAKAHGKGKMTQKQKARAGRRGQPEGRAGAGPGPDAGPGPSARRPSPGGGDRSGQVAADSASRSDPSGDGDRQGETPSYADIRRAGIAGRAGAVGFTIRVDGSIPKAGTGEGVDMTASFHFRMRNGDEHQIYAIGSNSGWRADLDNSGSFPGRFEIVRDTFLFELSWKRLGGASRLKWVAQTSWTRSADGPLDETDFAFDQVPEYGKASYPE